MPKVTRSKPANGKPADKLPEGVVRAYAGLIRGDIVLPHISPQYHGGGWVPVLIAPARYAVYDPETQVVVEREKVDDAIAATKTFVDRYEEVMVGQLRMLGLLPKEPRQ